MTHTERLLSALHEAFAPGMDRIRAGSLLGIDRIIEDHGGDVGKILNKYYIELECINSQNAHICFSEMILLLEHCASEFNSPHFGLKLSQYSSMDIFGSLATMMKSCSTVRQAMETGERFFFFQNPSGTMRMVVNGDVSYLTYAGKDPKFAFKRQVNELAMASGLKLMKMLVGDNFQPICVLIASDQPETGSAFSRRFFGSEVRYGEPHNAVEFPTELLDSSIASANTALFEISRTYIEGLTYIAQEDLRTAAEQIILELLPYGACNLPAVAERLRRHPRILQIELAKVGIKFRDLVANQRERLARAYLADTHFALCDVAALLGYSDQTTFTRAFSLWTSMSPRLYRITYAASHNAKKCA